MTDLTPAQELSKVFFNREHRLTIWHAVMAKSIEPPEPFRAKDMYDQVRPTANQGQVGEELKALVLIGAITPMPELDVLPSKYYRRVESKMWLVIQELAERTVELSTTLETEE